MKVIIIGHSYVKDLMKLKYDPVQCENVVNEIQYMFQPVATYESLLKKCSIFDADSSYKIISL